LLEVLCAPPRAGRFLLSLPTTALPTSADVSGP